ncbi:MAG: hypothetical protein ABJA10_08435 [Aestuariivirga sp.]
MGIETQVPTIKIPVHELIRRKAFMLGYEAARKSKPFYYLHPADDGDEWQYERGRQFAIYLKTIGKKRMPLLKNDIPVWRMTHLLAEAFKEKAIT